MKDLGMNFWIEMKRLYLILIIIGILIIGWFAIRFFIGGNEDSWIKDSKGIYIKHGHPSKTPDYVTEQQEAINCAFGLYDENKNQGIQFFSQCLGRCGDYAVDIVHIPRTGDDNLFENQCLDYKEGRVSKFIELDKNKEIVKIV